jgi:hypothetical protein
MRVRERGSDIPEHSVGSLERAWPAFVQHLAQCSPWHELHNEREASVANASHSVQRDDVRMPKLRDGSRLACEARYRFIVIRELRADDFDCDLTAELAITRAIHDSSSPAAKLPEYLVFALEVGRDDLCFRIT